MHNTVEKIMHVRPLWGKETSEIGIGINTGKAILASLGCDERMDYTALGESLKIAAQLERVARGGGIIIGEETYRQTQGQFPVQKRGEIHIKQRTEPVVWYEVGR
jgi:adenylate cyclase